MYFALEVQGFCIYICIILPVLDLVQSCIDMKNYVLAGVVNTPNASRYGGK